MLMLSPQSKYHLSCMRKYSSEQNCDRSCDIKQQAFHPRTRIIERESMKFSNKKKINCNFGLIYLLVATIRLCTQNSILYIKYTVM